MTAAGGLDGIGRSGSLGDHIEPALLEGVAHEGPSWRVVIGDEDPVGFP
jgi:hypothetical protein